MAMLEKLTLDGAVSLLTYLQCRGLQDESLGATALVAILCEMLNQIEATYPGITDIYGWRKTSCQSDGVKPDTVNSTWVDDDNHSVFNITHVS